MARHNIINTTRLKLNREESNMTQRELAEIMEVDPSTVSKWETGERVPEPKHMQKFAELFGRDEAAKIFLVSR